MAANDEAGSSWVSIFTTLPRSIWVMTIAYCIYKMSHEFVESAKVKFKKDQLHGYMESSDISNIFDSGNALIVFLTAPMLAHLSDLFGRKPLLLYAFFGEICPVFAIAVGGVPLPLLCTPHPYITLGP